jgi:hypothetical protein
MKRVLMYVQNFERRQENVFVIKDNMNQEITFL